MALSVILNYRIFLLVFSMASIPLFEGPAGSLPRIAPLDVGIESLELRGRESGARLAESGERIEGMRQARDINRTRQEEAELDLNQKRRLAPLELEARRTQLESEIDLAPEKRAAVRAELEARQDEFAQQAQLRQQSQELLGVLQSGDPQAKVQAVTSGQFAQVFAAAPNLQKYAISVTYPLMTDAQKEGFQSQSANADLRNYYLKQQQKISEDFQTSLSNLAGNQTANTVVQDYYKGRVPLTDLPNRVSFVRSDAYERDPETGEPIMVNGRVKMNSEAPEGKPTSYDLFDKQTGQRIQTGVDLEDKKIFEAYKSNRFRASQYDLNVPDFSVPSKTVERIDQAESARPQPAEPAAAQAPTQYTGSEQGSVAGGTPTGTSISMGGAQIPQRTAEVSEFTPVTRNLRVRNPNFQGPSLPTSPTGRTLSAESANTPDTNQLTVQTTRDRVLGGIVNNPARQETYQKKAEQFRGRTEQLQVGKEDATFPVAIGQTEQLLQNVTYRPQDIRDEAITTVNREPLLAGKPPLIKAIAAVESGGRRGAKSPTGVRGLLQVTRATAAQYGLNRDIPEENVLAGEKELYRNLKLAKTPELALAGYNAGIGIILDAIRETNSYDWDVVKDHLRGVLPPRKFREVEFYPEKVLNYAAIFSRPAADEVEV